MIERPLYLKQLIDARDNGFPKVTIESGLSVQGGTLGIDPSPD